MNKNLYVVTCISNPVRYHSRYALYKDFAKRVKDAGAILYTVEIAFGDRPFEITDADNPHHIQVRSFFELWHKENMLNLGIRRLPIDWEYAAWIDADVQFTRADWVEETIQQLQHYMFVQMFSHSVDLSPRYEPIKTHTGFVHDWYHNPDSVRKGGYATFSHPGYAWAARREALDYVGGLIDFGILGSGDRHMACAMIGKVEHSFHKDVSQDYKDECFEWQRRCNKFIKTDIGYVGGTINHFWHGAKADRRYNDRWKILVKNNYRPNRDAYYDTQGLLQLDPERVQLRDDIRKYFRARFEDSDWTGQPHKLLP
jgi:hypothetical protein